MRQEEDGWSDCSCYPIHGLNPVCILKPHISCVMKISKSLEQK